MPSATFGPSVSTSSNSLVTLSYDGIQISSDGSQAKLINPTATFTYKSGWSDSSNSSSWGGDLLNAGSRGSVSYSGGSTATWTTSTYFTEKWVDISYGGTSDYTFSFTMTDVSFYSGGSASRTCDWIITFPQRVSSVGAVSSVAAFDMGATVSLSWTRPDPNSTVDVWWNFGTLAVQLLNNSTATSTSWVSSIATMAPQIPNAASGVGNISVDYYDGSGNWVGTVDKNFTANVPSSVVPTAGTFTLAEGTAAVTTVMGAMTNTFVKSLSKLTATYSGQAGVYSSTISKVEFLIDSVPYVAAGSPWTSGTLSSAGASIPVVKRVTDSRGRTATTSTTITVMDYSAPSIASFNAARCNSGGTETGSGTYIKAKPSVSISSLVNGTEKNQLTIAVYTKLKTDSVYVQKYTNTFAVGATVVNYSASGGPVLGTGGEFAATSVYDVRIDVSDKFNAATPSSQYIVISTETVPLSISNVGIGVGKIWTQGSVDALGDIYAGGLLYEGGVPISAKYRYSPNKILNSAFDFWDRGTSFTMSTVVADIWSAERWINYRSSGGTGMVSTISRQAFTPGAAPVSGYEGKYFMRWAVTTAGTGFTDLRIEQRVEDVRTLAGQTVTLSFWAKSTANSVLPAVGLRQMFGTSGSADVDYLSGTVPLSTTWTRYSFTFNLGSMSGKTIGAANNDYLNVMIKIPINTTCSVDIWGVQLEAGSIATPWSRSEPTIASEIAACQRYHFLIDGTDANYAPFGPAFINSASQVDTVIRHIVRMRANPVVTFSAASSFQIQADPGGGACTAMTVDITTREFTRIYCTASTQTMTAGKSAVLLRNAATSPCWIDFQAEL